ncbi:MAG: DUF1553 domain-containing protein, partial [Bryobacteraceae bacterium]
ARLIDELLAKSEWVDKWTMYFGDIYNNNARNTFLVRYEPGRNAFYKWIRNSLTANKPYNQMATELISSQGTNTFAQGELNWLVGGWVIGNPQQDNMDQEAANVSETFLGISHMNCLLCHNGRGHLDSLSLWGKTSTRMQAWGFSSFLSHTVTTRTPVQAAVNNQPYYWAVTDDPPRITDYALNNAAGNRPTRAPVGTQRTVAPNYPFGDRKPASGENYRVALARFVTTDIQFARATVNYMWKEFFGRGIVDPANQFDPARLDPDNPPPAPWTLQPSNARLLNAMAQDFVDSGYDLKALMRGITNSETYQLSSQYNGVWNPDWDKYFARKSIRRLWAAEIHDAVAQSSNVMPTYNIANFSTFAANSPFTGNQTFGPVNWAMQAPDVLNMPDNGGAVTIFLNGFLRGNRDDEERRPDGSLQQALNLMNDAFVTTRLSKTGPATSLLVRNILLPNNQLIDTMFLHVLSRYPTDAERKIANQQIDGPIRSDGVENLLWSLYNKVDFVFNY